MEEIIRNMLAAANAIEVRGKNNLAHLYNIINTLEQMLKIGPNGVGTKEDNNDEEENEGT